MADAPRRLRCAVYTRKSTEEGLEQAFNTLDAQREACAAYVLSQQHEGWTLLPDFYDDGGYSGGNIERPGLKQLLGDVRAGRVDVVVVYKIDRLTRSLTDFAKIVDVLDEAKASFVSVTQAFNTTNSMGRLTLNVLLSFAQFEREVIAERIRDKVAASKARGMWMGGSVPLGYRVEDRKLIVVPEEAATVREIMERYLRIGSVRELLIELQREGIVTARRTHKGERISGGTPFTRGGLNWLLKNRTYIGEVVHKGNIFPGQQDAIVSRELFDAVQARLAERTNPRSPTCSRRPVSLLTGMIFDQRGRPMSPVHTHNHGRRYRYYASNLADDATLPAQRLPAGELDSAVRAAVADWLGEGTNVRTRFKDTNPAELPAIIAHCQDMAGGLRTGLVTEIRAILQELKLRVTASGDGITCAIHLDELLKSAGFADLAAHGAITIPLAATPATFGHESRLQLDPPAGVPAKRDERLVDLVVRGFAAREQLIAMSESDVSAMPETVLRHIERTARLSYLCPRIVAAIFDGTQPRTLTARLLARMASLPLAWTEQRQALGFERA
jgi:DNA invertase Pin-like site-specific DNA recombinase